MMIKAEKREKRRAKKKKFKVSGAKVKDLAKLIERKGKS